MIGLKFDESDSGIPWGDYRFYGYGRDVYTQDYVDDNFEGNPLWLLNNGFYAVNGLYARMYWGIGNYLGKEPIYQKTLKCIGTYKFLRGYFATISFYDDIDNFDIKKELVESLIEEKGGTILYNEITDLSSSHQKYIRFYTHFPVNSSINSEEAVKKHILTRDDKISYYPPTFLVYDISENWDKVELPISGRRLDARNSSGSSLYDITYSFSSEDGKHTFIGDLQPGTIEYLLQDWTNNDKILFNFDGDNTMTFILEARCIYNDLICARKHMVFRGYGVNVEWRSYMTNIWGYINTQNACVTVY